MTTEPAVSAMAAVEAQPYQWPFDGVFTGERSAVVVCAAQRWAVERCPHWDAVRPRLEVVVDVARHAGALVVWVAHGTVPGSARRHAAGAVLPAHGSAAAALVVDPAPGDVMVTAGGLDGFYAGPLDDTLRAAGRELLVVCGAALETASHSTLRSANDRGYECLTLVDGTAAADPALAAAAQSSICMSGGIFGATATCDALLASLGTASAAMNPTPAPDPLPEELCPTPK